MKFLRHFPYWYLLLIPALLFCLGAVSNQAVLWANGGKFPVFMNDAQKEKYCPADSSITSLACGNGGQFIDRTHSVMGPNSRLKLLADVFNFGAIYSVGDGFLFLASWLFSFTPYMWVALVVRKLYVETSCPSKV